MKIKLILLIIYFSFIPTVQSETLFRLPLTSNPGYSAWFDHNSTSGSFKRYDCSTKFGYDGHTGTDFTSSSGTQVYAGASGELYYRVDGCPDGSNPSCGSSYGNHVRIRHVDGLVSIYAHLKNGTASYEKSVLCGGKVGSSGNSGKSSGPHLHFELWQSTSIGRRLDFFSGSCNSKSYWVSQNSGWPKTTCQ